MLNKVVTIMISDMLVKLRSEAGLTQADVAKVLGISSAAYGFYEQGKRDVNSKVVVQLARLYGCTTDYIYGLENTKKDTSLVDEVSKMLSNLSIDELKEIRKYVKFIRWSKEHQD